MFFVIYVSMIQYLDRVQNFGERIQRIQTSRSRINDQRHGTHFVAIVRRRWAKISTVHIQRLKGQLLTHKTTD